MENMNYSLSDLAAVTGSNGIGMGGNGGLLILIVLFLLFGGGFNRGTGEFGQYATAASQQEILFGQQFQGLDNKIDRIGNGIADATFALNNAIVAGTNNVAGTVVSEGRAMADKLCELRTEIHAEGEATRAMIQRDKIESLQAQVSELKTQNMFCGVPRINPYGFGVYAYNNAPACPCGGV